MDLSELRQEYSRTGLDRKELADSPFEQFDRWFRQASEGGIREPNAMSLATAAPLREGAPIQPTLRTVLLKGFDERGFVFYTNYESNKAKQIDTNPQVALMFPWVDLERQVIIYGTAIKLSPAESLKYFTSRPRGSQLGAWVSQQSRPISSRQMLEIQFAKMKEKFRDGKIPLPSFWGGYRVTPESIEFWQGRESRLHDRFLYTRTNEQWHLERLCP